MTNAQITTRLENIERELSQIKLQLGGKRDSDWRALAGTFADDPLFEKAMRYGAQYRNSLRPKPRKRRTRSR